MDKLDFTDLKNYCKAFCALTPERETLLRTIAPEVVPYLGEVTDGFYAQLTQIERAQPFLANRLESLKHTHRQWLESVFTSDFDEEYTRYIYHVGDVHVKVKLPVEFMAGAMTQIQQHLLPILVRLYGHDAEKLSNILSAVSAALGFNLQVMQESYQASSLSAELEKFLKITGMSRKLFDNLAAAYR